MNKARPATRLRKSYLRANEASVGRVDSLALPLPHLLVLPNLFIIIVLILAQHLRRPGPDVPIKVSTVNGANRVAPSHDGARGRPAAARAAPHDARDAVPAELV